MDWLLDVFATWLYGLKVIAITLAVIMFISGLDDFFIDVVYWVRRIKRKLSVYRRYPRMSYRELYKPDEKPLAIMVPAWNETGVIGNMAELAATTLDYENYHIFVGTYPNDPDTQRDVDEVCARFPNVHKVVCARPGPTSKADCLNNVLDAIRMYDAGGTVIYVGKAKDLKKRLSSYFRSNLASRKTEALVAQIQQIDVTVTHTETEALLLEHNYIKLYQPRYNVLLRDDKSYPFIFLSGDTHPRLAMHRGAKHAKGEYFGPFPNGYAVRETLALLQKIFPIRQCENSVYRNRSRPCLQYQIGRCLGPCVEGLVSEEEYAQQVEYVRLFLSGKDDQVLTQLISRMETASQNLEFEEAARIRDQIQAVRRVTEKQFVSNTGDDLDVIGVAFDAGMACVHVLFIRQGKVLGSRSYFPKVPGGTELSDPI